MTRQTSAFCVLEILAQPGAPHGLLFHASIEAFGLWFATVYRAIKEKLEIDKFRKIELAGMPLHYEVENDKFRYFFVGEDCQKRLDIDV